ncbi:ABC transporter permease [Alsobacter metallidurans]|uniref:ABC transporter permease n=1 Tax=Alsobacter metallidurans TaxID=340221 RepID=A0A917I7L5_9HYPH|nr:ABC transporter permease [Alsobacter metallidurans]GGH22993.1 ABC transporter permease [Alsobacter metallidurans]
MKARRAFDPVLLLAAPALAYMALVFALPVLILIIGSFKGPGGPTTAAYTAFLSDAFNWRVIGNTLRVAALTSLVCLVLGYPTAVALARSRGAVQAGLLIAIILPLSVGVIVKAFAWQIVLRRDGIVSAVLVATGVWDAPQLMLFTEPGLVIGAANVFLPFMILPIYSVLKLIDPNLQASAATLGAPPLYRFFKLALPMAMPGIISGAAIVFSLSAAMYVIPTLLIGDRFQTLATLTARAFLLMRNEQLGSTTATILLVLAVSIVMLSARLVRAAGDSR